jgi:poly-gamma-glutamate synthase PgsB/CapB
VIGAWGSGRTAFLFCLALWLLWIVWLAWESRRHGRNLDALRLRIHVNGTRGKSGVTRLIAAGLRAGGYRTLAKVTGSEAKIIDPDGSERPVLRRGPANIREYLRTVKEAVDCGAEVLVTECMALQPELQGFCERRLMHSHIGVITNVRHDHEEIMGWSLPAIASALGRTVPERGTLVATPETAELLRTAGCAGGAGTSLRPVDAGAITAEELAGFPFAVEADNVALALAVCEAAGVAREQAMAGMQASQPDVGNLTVREYQVEGHTLRFIDAMAANDPDSTRILWDRYVGTGAAAAGILIHARPDRRLRTRTLSALLAGLQAGPYYLTGDTAFAARCLRQQGIPAERIIPVAVPALNEVLAAVAGSKVEILFAAGNRKGFIG